MRTAYVSPRNSQLHLRAQVVSNHSANALKAFSTAKLVEHKLQTATSTFVPDLHSNMSDTRKTLVRLKTMFSRVLEKRIPYVEYAERPFFQIVNRQQFVVTVCSEPQPINSDASYGDFGNWNSRDRRDHCTDTAYIGAIDRYLQHLQFLCLKNAVPLKITPTYEVALTTRQVRSFGTIATPEVRATKNFEVQYSATIHVEVVAWENHAYSAMLENSDLLALPPIAETIDEFLAVAIRNDGEPEAYSADNWTAHSITEYGFPGDNLTANAARYKRYMVPEKIFFYIPQILRVLNTLTRKTYYVSSAFSIGAVEGS